jgi:hypothetical protein
MARIEREGNVCYVFGNVTYDENQSLEAEGYKFKEVGLDNRGTTYELWTKVAKAKKD